LRFDSENSWISVGLPSSSRRRRRGDGRGDGGEWREKWSASGFDVGVDSAKSEIKVEKRCDPGCRAEDFAESVIVNHDTVIGIVVVVNGHHSARTDISMPVHDGGIRTYVGFLVDTVKARGGTMSRGTRRCDT